MHVLNAGDYYFRRHFPKVKKLLNARAKVLYTVGCQKSFDMVSQLFCPVHSQIVGYENLLERSPRSPRRLPYVFANYSEKTHISTPVKS